MTKNELTSNEILQCYRNAHKKLSPHDQKSVSEQSEMLAENLRGKSNKPISEYTRLEILAKLGIFLSKKIPADEDTCVNK